MDGAKGEAAASPALESFASVPQLLALCALGGVVYLALALAARDVPDSVKIGVPFLALPAAFIIARGKRLAVGRLDLTLLYSAAVYAPFAVIAAVAAPGARWFYAPLALAVAGPAGAAWWAADTFFHVGAVDFFSKRVVQSEAEVRFGPARALLIQLFVWSGAHAIEWLWLRQLFGDLGAAAYLVAAGIITGLAYIRWRNVLGLMIGHFLVNVCAAAAAVTLYG